MCAKCLQLIRPLADQQHVDLAGDYEASCETHVLADRPRLKQVVLNLLSNAVKYNREGRRATISCDGRQTGKLRTNVRDTGYRIRPANLERLFSPFDRLQADQTTVEGTGLGKALSKRLIELIGGHIGVQSKLGEGSLFWLELPIGEAPVQHLERTRPNRETTAVATQDTPQKTLLYIEDNLSNLRLIKRIFEKRPEIKRTAAMQGNLGLDLARQHRPDLNLPDISGADVLRPLKGESATAEIPVIVVTADATPRQIEKLKAARANDYLVKPIDVRKLLAVIEKTLARNEPYALV